MVTTSLVLETIGRVIPKVARPYRYVIVREMQEMKLIKRINHKKYMITGGNVNARLNKYIDPLWHDVYTNGN